jgi:hypothetical protein
MKLLKPIKFDVSHLISSNAVETYAPYNAGTTYAKDDYVDYATQIYQSLVNSNLGKTPDTNPLHWQLVGPDNTHAMFDNQVSTKTTSSTPLIVEVKPDKAINALAFLNLDATELIVELDDPIAGNVYSNTIDLDDTIILDWYDYFFEPFRFSTEVVLTDIPSYKNSTITITLSKSSGSVSIGNFVYGSIYHIGHTQYGTSIGNKDFSVKETDEYGNTTFIERAFSRRMQAPIILDKTQTRSVSTLLDSVRATPCVWIGSEDSDYKPTIVFGFYKEFSMEIAYPTFNKMTLEIEGLI